MKGSSHEQTFPNETREYREARDRLLKEEQALVDRTKAVAEMRRKLPRGGELKEDYVFQWATEEKLGKRVKFSELFGDKGTLSEEADLRPAVAFLKPGAMILDSWVRRSASSDPGDFFRAGSQGIGDQLMRSRRIGSPSRGFGIGHICQRGL